MHLYAINTHLRHPHVFAAYIKKYLNLFGILLWARVKKERPRQIELEQ